MNTELQKFAELLAKFSDRELAALRSAAELSPQAMSGLLAWLEHAFGWEIDRRTGFQYRLAWPMEAIPPEETAASVAAMALMADSMRVQLGTGGAAITAAMEQATFLIEAKPARYVRARTGSPRGGTKADPKARCSSV